MFRMVPEIGGPDVAATGGTPDHITRFGNEGRRPVPRVTGVVTRGRRSRMRGRIALLTISLGTVGWTVVLSAPPARADCSLFDPICVVEEATDPVTDVVEPIVEDVTEEVVEPAIEVVVEVVGEVIETVDEVAEGVADPPGEIVPAIPSDGSEGTLGETVPGTVPGTLPPNAPTAPSDPTDPVGPGVPGSDQATTAGSSIGGAGATGGSSVTPTRASIGLAAPGTSSLGGAAPADPAGVRPSFIDRLGEAIVVVTNALVFPIELVILLAAFVLVQHRMDRRDPRLVLAPVRPSVLRFD
jgi:hypothetical protein